MEQKRLGNVYGEQFGTGYAGNVWDADHIAPAIMTMQGGVREPMVVDVKEEYPLNPMEDGTCRTIKNQYHQTGPSNMNRGNTFGATGVLMVKQATKQGYIECEVGGVADLSYPTSQTRRARVIENGTVCPTLTTESIPSVLEPWIWEIDGVRYLIRIRKLTPKETWRLMGFAKRSDDGTWDDSAFERAEKVCSNTQLFKQSGNSIVVDCLEHIFKELL